MMPDTDTNEDADTVRKTAFNLKKKTIVAHLKRNLCNDALSRSLKGAAS